MFLDGLRGIAAAAVVGYHLSTARSIRWLVPHGDLAVDFFFVLSGFVLAHAYEARLQAGELSPLGFLRLRVRRLWPMVALGTLVGVALTPGHDVIAASFGVLMLPDLLPGPSYPLNPPHWSVAAEIVANYAYAIVAPRLTTGVLCASVVLAAAWVAVRPGIASRVAFGFGAGVLLYRVWKAGWRPSVTGWLLAALLVLCFVAPLSATALRLVVFPGLVLLGASATTPLETSSRFLGRLSYPLYAIHYPILMALIRVFGTAST